MQSVQVESTYGDTVTPEKAPEVVAKAVACLPPEQMYELMKQMKQCIQVFSYYSLRLGQNSYAFKLLTDQEKFFNYFPKILMNFIQHLNKFYLYVLTF